MLKNPEPRERESVWERIRDCGKPVVLYGMGNGADKILAVMEKYGVLPADFFASDGFVRGHAFHGKTVLSLAQIREKYSDPLIVIAFASALPEVMANMDALDGEFEVVAPDVPVAGDTLFTRGYFEEHRAEFEEAYALLADEESRRIFQALIEYKISGKLSYLHSAESDPDAVLRELVHPETVRCYADFGAYTGDTIRALLEHAENLETVYAMEPDARTFRKLSAYAAEEERARINVFPYAAWDKHETLVFRSEGNRNSAPVQNGTAGIGVRQAKEKTVITERPDALLAGETVDFIKYDVEGSEREALLGTRETIARCTPRLLVSIYHRTEDLFALPLLLHSMEPRYRFYLRRFPYIPAWDINLYCIPE